MSLANGLNAFNALLQNLLGLAVVGILCALGWVGYEQWYQGERLGAFREKLKQTEFDLRAEQQRNVQLQEQVEKLDTALHLIKVDHRLAEIRVLDQRMKPGTNELWSQVEFVEIAEGGQEIGEAKTFNLKGDKVYVDYWVVKFADEYVERSEINRATSICLFRGIHGEYQSPAEAYRLDTVGSRPAAYARGATMSEFEQQIWSDFWEFANNPELARQKGIRAAHGEEPYTAVRKGMTYRLELRASGGLSIAPVDRVQPRPAEIREPIAEARPTSRRVEASRRLMPNPSEAQLRR